MTTSVQITAYCFECQSEQPAEIIGDDCDVAAEGFRSEFNDDGTLYGRTGVHMRGTRCLTCGDTDGEPCIHD